MSSKLNYVIPVVCGLAFLVGLSITINPTLGVNNTYANESAATSAGDPGISLSLNGNTDMQKIVNTPGEVSYIDNTFSVKVTDSWYAVLVRAANGYTSDLINQQNTNAKVTGVGINVPESNFKENTWGYALTTITSTEQSSSVDNKTLSYNTVPESNDYTPAYSNTVSGEQTQNFKVSFAAKFGNDAPSGHYQTKVYLSAVSNPNQIATIYEFTATTMQGLSKGECIAAAENTTKQLIDTRDGKKYWVTKLKDGNCWMTQNLDYNGPSGRIETTAISSWPDSGTPINYMDPGDLFYKPDADNGQNGNCSSNGTTDFSCPTQFEAISNPSDEDYHRHIGNYYTWNAATNGTGNNMTSGTPSGSICPNGDWKLPTSNNIVNGSFAYLLQQYNMATSATSATSAIEGVTYKIWDTPLYFMYSGHLNSGKFYNAGGSGYYWSSTPNSNGTSAYGLNVYSSVNPSHDRSRHIGMSVRCLVIGS